jgi:hypothetical protein
MKKNFNFEHRNQKVAYSLLTRKAENRPEFFGFVVSSAPFMCHANKPHSKLWVKRAKRKEPRSWRLH